MIQPEIILWLLMMLILQEKICSRDLKMQVIQKVIYLIILIRLIHRVLYVVIDFRMKAQRPPENRCSAATDGGKKKRGSKWRT